MKATYSKIAVLPVLALVASMAVRAEPESLLDELRDCARTIATDARIACYEALGQKALQAGTTEGTQASSSGKSADASPAPAVVAGGAQSSPDDTIGGYKFEDKPTEVDADALASRVVDCQRSFEGIWYFRLENGQVWKQVDRQTLNFQACDFPATVTKDGLGYVLKIEGRKGKIRISRRK